MTKKQPKESLADRVAGVLSAVPSQFDSEDENIDDTRAKLADFDDPNEQIVDGEALLSKIRKQNIDLLSDVDRRYAGKKGSRKNLKGNWDEFSEEASADNEDIEEESVDDNDEELDDQHAAEYGASEESENESESRSESESDLENSDLEGSVSLLEKDDSNFQHMSEKNTSEQVNKGLFVRNQINIWENLLEMRIQIQKGLVAANKMPQKNYFKKMEMVSNSVDLRKNVNETKECLFHVLDKLVTLQKLVLRKYPETKNLGKTELQSRTENASDEEILSDIDEEVEDKSDDLEQNTQPQETKRRRLNDYEQDISDLHNKYKQYRNNTIEKWNTKTRLSVTRNSGQTLSVVSQVEHILSDKDKLRKRTQLKRSEYRILGQEDESAGKMESNEDNGDVKKSEEYNSEIFDDTDFYHQLLRELIEVKSADITDPVQLGRQWIQLQNLRSKMKRKIDTRATKGRKIRYAIHTKLVNCMAPMDNQSWTEEAKNELYSSLFGKIQPKPA